MDYRVDKRDLAIIEAKARKPSMTLKEIAGETGTHVLDNTTQASATG